MTLIKVDKFIIFFQYITQIYIVRYICLVNLWGDPRVPNNLGPLFIVTFRHEILILFHPNLLTRAHLGISAIVYLYVCFTLMIHDCSKFDQLI